MDRPFHSMGRRARVAIVMLLAIIAASSMRSEAAAPTTADLEAALLMTFARYAEWPAGAFTSASAPMMMGVVGDDEVAEALARASVGKNVAGRSVAVRRLQWDSDTTGVHVLFVGQSEKRRMAVLIGRLDRQPILTVSELPEFGGAGGMITLVNQGGRISFSVNSHAAEAVGLRFSSFLLSHATHVSHTSPKSR